MPERDRSTYVIHAVENALEVLSAISQEPGDFALTTLSARLGMDKSYVFRVLATFEHCGYVQQADSSGHYRAGLAAYETSGGFLHQSKLLQLAKPLMESLAKACDEAVYLAIAGGEDLLLIEMVDSPQQVRVMPLAGRRFALDQFSAGRVIQAYAGPENPSASQQAIRRQEFFADHGLVGAEIGSLAVPILNAQGLACASLCILAPEFRFGPERIEQHLLPFLKDAGHELSAKLGHISNKLRHACA